jgi:hypothetical protein
MSKQPRWRIPMAVFVCLLGVAQITLALVESHGDWLRLALGVIFVIGGAMTLRKLLNERANA